MYSDKKKKHRGWIGLLAALAVIGVLVYTFAGGSGTDLKEESEAAIREAVRRSALQCYVVEGVYPPNLAYLEENYGLQVNTRDYYVAYDAFSSNMPPDIRVGAK
ncbi:MAG: hypothetical protein IJ106_13315 [Parasporobacterium sp.]|nr:hypothetical protein [Parasporobacterium sp.]